MSASKNATANPVASSGKKSAQKHSQQQHQQQQQQAKEAADAANRVMAPSAKRLTSLFTENERVQNLRNQNDLLERLIMDEDGTDLRATVAAIGRLVVHSLTEFNMLHERMQATMEKRHEGSLSSFVHQKFSDTDMKRINHMFDSVLEGNPNDDKARVAQLAILFCALTLEVDVRKNLTPEPKHVDRFADREVDAEGGGDGGGTSDVDADRAAQILANVIEIEPFVQFMKNNARQLLTQLFAGRIDLRAYVSECSILYLSYKQPICARVAMQYYGLPGANNSSNGASDHH